MSSLVRRVTALTRPDDQPSSTPKAPSALSMVRRASAVVVPAAKPQPARRDPAEQAGTVGPAPSSAARRYWEYGAMLGTGWLVLTALLMIFARHAVPFTVDAAGAFFLSTIVTVAIAKDREQRIRARGQRFRAGAR